jgi:hypothetical protein
VKQGRLSRHAPYGAARLQLRGVSAEQRDQLFFDFVDGPPRREPRDDATAAVDEERREVLLHKLRPEDARLRRLDVNDKSLGVAACNSVR